VRFDKPCPTRAGVRFKSRVDPRFGTGILITASLFSQDIEVDYRSWNYTKTRFPASIAQ
jgi:hypothetical protein